MVSGDPSLKKFIEGGLKDNMSVSDIRTSLKAEGFSDKKITYALKDVARSIDSSKKDSKDVSLVNKKLLIDKLGYGFGATQFVYILFYLTGASIFFVGMLNAFKSAFGAFLSSFLSEYSKRREVPKRFMAISGLLFGFSFLFMAASYTIGSVWLFAMSILIGSVGVVAYGDFFIGFVKKNVKSEKIIFLMPRFTFLGIIITAVSLFIAGFLLDLFPLTGKIVALSLFGLSLSINVLGYLLVFEIAAILFITSAYFIFKLEAQGSGSLSDLRSFMWDYFEQVYRKTKKFLSNKFLLVLTIAMIFISVFQGVVNSYMGIHIFTAYKDSWLLGFTNVAIVYALALLFSFSGPIIAAKLNKHLGLAPMLVFGTILMAFFPFIAAFNPYFPALVVGGVLSIIGGAIIGSAHNLLAGKILNERDKNDYYVSTGLLTIIPFLVILGFLAFYANAYGILTIFKYVSFGAIILIIPLYLLLVFWTQKYKF